MWKKTLLFSFPFILGMGLNSPVSALDAYPTLRLAQVGAPDNTGRDSDAITPGVPILSRG